MLHIFSITKDGHNIELFASTIEDAEKKYAKFISSISNPSGYSLLNIEMIKHNARWLHHETSKNLDGSETTIEWYFENEKHRVSKFIYTDHKLEDFMYVMI